MTRVLLAALALAALLPGPSRADGTAVRLTVQPMPAPKPALKYLLLPEVRELKTGNPVQWYIRCFQEQRNFFFGKAATAERARYRAMPLADLPAGQLRGYGGSALTQADFGARLDTPDWDALQRVQGGGTDLRLSELGPLRILSWGLQVRFRGEVAGRHFDDAVRTAKTMFALARHLGECPVGAANRLGLSFADLALDTLEEMVQQPGCPNLYWALTDLPAPLVDLRKGLQGDGVLAAADLKSLRDDPMTEAELDEVLSRLSGALGFARQQAGRPPRSLRAVLRAGVKDKDKLRAARGRQIAASSTAKFPSGQFFRAWAQAENLPPVQVLLLDEKRAFEVQRDEQMKLLALAPWQIARIGAKSCRGLFADLVPDVLTVRRAQARVEQRIALLRHVEALRLYAAAHSGRLPAQLADCDVPLPNDPFSGKPFRYQARGNTADLRGEAKEAPFYYQLTVRK
jgi:hypothetical protein